MVGILVRAGRVWIMDRGLVSEKNVQFLRAGARRYILGTGKSSLRKFERELLSEDWKQVHEGLEVRLVPAPDGEEVFILCRSAERQAKEQAMHKRFEKRIEEGLVPGAEMSRAPKLADDVPFGSCAAASILRATAFTFDCPVRGGQP